jgi:hypothetical protein
MACGIVASMSGFLKALNQFLQGFCAQMKRSRMDD